MEGMIYRSKPWSETTRAYCVSVIETKNKILLYHVSNGKFMTALSLKELSQVAYTTKFIQFQHEGDSYSLSAKGNVLFDLFYYHLNR